MKKEKSCPRCKRIRPNSDFVDLSGSQNLRGKYCIKCHKEMKAEALRNALKGEASYIPKLKIIYGKYWKHYALPHDFETTLYHERDFCPYCGKSLPPHYIGKSEASSPFRGRAHLDHMDPLSKGGEDSIRNAVYVCGKCNCEKGELPFTKWLGKLLPKHKKLAREIYIEKHRYPPEKFKKGSPTPRTDGLSYELSLDEDELKEMYPEPIADSPPSEEKITITISLDDILNSPEAQKFINKNNKRSKR